MILEKSNFVQNFPILACFIQFQPPERTFVQLSGFFTNPEMDGQNQFCTWMFYTLPLLKDSLLAMFGSFVPHSVQSCYCNNQKFAKTLTITPCSLHQLGLIIIPLYWMLILILNLSKILVLLESQICHNTLLHRFNVF